MIAISHYDKDANNLDDLVNILLLKRYYKGDYFVLAYLVKLLINNSIEIISEHHLFVY